MQGSGWAKGALETEIVWGALGQSVLFSLLGLGLRQPHLLYT